MFCTGIPFTRDEEMLETCTTAMIDSPSKTEWSQNAISLLIENCDHYRTQLETKNSVKKHIWKK